MINCSDLLVPMFIFGMAAGVLIACMVLVVYVAVIKG
jgi:hypothetical protein